MPLVSAKCPYCGGNLKINDQAKDKLICPFCGSSYLVEQAINIVNVSNSVVNNINADNIIVSGYDEQTEITKARQLIGKDDNLAAKIYNKIFENNPQNFEAEYLRIILNNETKIENVEKLEYVYNDILKMKTLENKYHQEIVPLYSEEEKNSASFKLLYIAVELNFEELIPVLRQLYSVNFLVNGKMLVYNAKLQFSPFANEQTAYKFLSFLYTPEEAKKDVLSSIEISCKLHNSCSENYYLDRINHQENIMLLFDPTYQKRNVEPKKELKYESKQGCYIATCVYGSYDCSEVWVLRRFRDYKLAKSWYGRLFIKCYYLISPRLVKLFGNKEWFKKIWRNKLNKMVEKYKLEGYEDSPYNDLY